MKRETIKISLLFCAALLLALLFAACGQNEGVARAEENESLFLGENVLIDGVNVSGLSLEKARSTLDAAHQALLESLSYTVEAEGEKLVLRAADLPVSYDTDAVLRSAATLKKHYPQKNAARTFSCKPSINAEALRVLLHDALLFLNKEPQNASASFTPKEKGRFTFEQEESGRTVDILPLALKLQKAVEEDLKNGHAPDDASAFSVEATELSPAYTLEMAQNDNALLASFDTSFKGSVYGKKNRVFNIVKAAGLLSGVSVAPGEEFDTNKILGARNAQNGWKEAAAIRDATYVQEYGGGVCQVSTTLYNAVLMADLTVTERYHHSWPLGYVSIGRDATISTGGPNFKFLNDTGANITVYAYADEVKKTIHVELYGRKRTDGLTIKLKSYKTETLEKLGEEIVLDKALPLGTRQVTREERVGSVAETYKEYYDADGKLVKRALVTRDKYRSVKGLISVSQDLYYTNTALPVR